MLKSKHIRLHLFTCTKSNKVTYFGLYFLTWMICFVVSLYRLPSLGIKPLGWLQGNIPLKLTLSYNPSHPKISLIDIVICRYYRLQVLHLIQPFSATVWSLPNHFWSNQIRIFMPQLRVDQKCYNNSVHKFVRRHFIEQVHLHICEEKPVRGERRFLVLLREHLQVKSN